MYPSLKSASEVSVPPQYNGGQWDLVCAAQNIKKYITLTLDTIIDWKQFRWKRVVPIKTVYSGDVGFSSISRVIDESVKFFG